MQSIYEGETVLETYRWDSFLRRHELALVTDIEGHYQSSTMSTSMRLVPMIAVTGLWALLLVYAAVFWKR